MSKLFRVTPSTMKPVVIKPSSRTPVDSEVVRTGLGAELASSQRSPAQSPISKYALREELVSRLQSSGGRPALAGVARRAKIPLSDGDWIELEKLADSLAAPGFSPTAGQVASALLTLSLRSLSSSPSAFAERASQAKAASFGE